MAPACLSAQNLPTTLLLTHSSRHSAPFPPLHDLAAFQWIPFGMSSSTALYVFLYALHYFMFKTKMTGLLQTAFYFGYSAMFCLGLALTCGAVGYIAAAAFVRTIYRNVKCD